ncbi:MAG: hypothetical protein JWL58_5762, partial [Streptosporangiaceae bacterium]|nr:hypothetical protein [Streptosporangiaceae bacterium]
GARAEGAARPGPPQSRPPSTPHADLQVLRTDLGDQISDLRGQLRCHRARRRRTRLGVQAGVR